MCSNDTLFSQSMPMWMFAAASLRPGISRSRPRGAPVPTEDGVVAFLHQCLHALDAVAALVIDVADVEDVADFLVDHFFRQTEARHLRAHEAAGFRIGFEHGDVITQRRQIARHGQRRGAGADACNTLAVHLCRRLGHAFGDTVFRLVVGGDTLQAADRYGFGFGFAMLTVFVRLRGLAQLDVAFFHTATAARGFARTVAGAAENAGEDIRLPVDHVGIVVLACRDHADVFGNGGVGRAGVLAIDNFMKVVGPRNIGGFQSQLRDRGKRWAGQCKYLFLFSNLC